MLTLQDQYQLYQQITGDYSAAGLVIAKRDINEGGAVFLNRLGRKFNKQYQTASLVANQQYYQLPSEVLRISEIKCLNGTNYYEPIYVASEAEWNAINNISTTSSIPLYYFLRGNNEIGLYPIPSANVTNGLSVSFEPQHTDLTQDDYTTGTITVTNASVTITHSGTGFLPQMVGRYIQTTDGTDGRWYRIASYTSTSVMSLENVYEGISGSGRTFRIGEVMKIPNGYQDGPVYYAADRHSLIEGDSKTAEMFRQRFEDKVKGAKTTYGSSTSRAGVKTQATRGRKPNWLDLSPPIVYP